MISFKTQQKWKLVDQIFQNGSLCEGCVYLDRRVGEGVQCVLLEDHMGQPEYCPQFEDAVMEQEGQ
tara:strand:+ start:1455 stop:1652 length:198 start_codon:yes stop_codon:yes gene_type:complete